MLDLQRSQQLSGRVSGVPEYHCVIISELSCQSHSIFTLNVVSFRQEKVEPLFESKLPPKLFLQTLELWCTV